MKNRNGLKYYLRGFGVGVVLTSIVFLITHSVTDIKTVSSEQEKESTGSALAYISNKESGKNENNESSTESPKESQLETQSESQSDTTKENQQETAVQKPTNKENVSETSLQEENNEKKTIHINFKNVYNATIASNILFDAGLIDDKKQFIEYLSKHGYATQMKDDEYDIESGSSYETIAKIITKTK